MSQSSVERVIGMLATDEAVRRWFLEDRSHALNVLADRGLELTPCERHALAMLDPADLVRFAESIDARLQKSDLGGEGRLP